MKGSILLLLAAVALSKAARIRWSDCLNPETVNILVPHDNCHKFYQCDDGNLIVRKCPAKLVFNIEDQRCDWPDNVDCENRGVPESNEEDSPESGTGGGNNDPNKAPEICAAEGSDGILIAHEYCNKYYICRNSIPVAMSCPAGLFFNADIDQCDWPENVECDRETAPQPQPEGSDEDEENEVVVPGPEPNPESGEGDNNGPGGGGNGDPSQAADICRAENSDGILIAHEHCNMFYICSEGRPVAMRCPRDLFFNPATDQCDWSENVECNRVPESDEEDNNGPVGGGNGDPSQAPEICRAENSDGILIAHEYCNKFYICSDGRPVAVRCPQGLFFNPATDQCDWPQNVECDRETAPQPQPEDSDEDEDNEVVVPGPEPNPESGEGDNNGSGGGGNGDPSQAAEICRAENSDGILIAHEHCNMFYICSEGRPVAMRCPRDLFFNPATDQCDWPENVKCNRVPESDEEDSNGPVGGGNGDPSQAPEICRAENSDGILIAHEYCNKFYICSDGRPVAVRCPQGLFFNPATDQCDWPQNVECDRETAPQPQPEGSDEDEDNEVVVPGPEPNPESGEGDNNGPGGGGNGDPSQAAEICRAENSDGILIAHEHCNMFYICSEGRPVAMRCPRDLFFNPATDQCDWPENVECNRVPESDEEDNNGPVGGGNGDPSQAPEICRAENSDGILIAHEYCNKFYICSDGRPVAVRCPQGLFFNPATDQCDWPQNVECDRETAPQPQPEDSDEDEDNEVVVPGPEPNPESGEGDNNGPGGGGNGDPSQAAEICRAENSDGILIAHEHCNMFYICSEGRPVAMRCPRDLFFNPATDQCDWPENVECNRVPESDEEDNNGPVGGGNGNPSQAPEICRAENSDGILIAHEYCNKFYICNDGRPVAVRCPQGLFFNPATDQCDWPQNVECDRETAPQPQPEGSDEDEDNEIVVPGPEPNPESGEGDNNGPVGGGNGDPSQAAEICRAENSDGVLVAHEYCNKFYKCSEGRPVAMRCPRGLFFNPATDQCDWPENVECDRETAPQPQPEGSDEDNEVVVPGPEPNPESGEGDNNGPVGGGNGDPSQAAEICRAENSDGILIAHEYCNKFYKCSEGRPVAMRCPRGLFFNPATDQCDWPENVECDREIAPKPQPEGSDEDEDNEVVVPGPEPNPESGEEDNNGSGGGGNGDPSQAAEICRAENSDGILIAHEYCNMFYICSEGRPVAMRCPRDLFFNPATDQCDWSENVECNRVPESEEEDNNGPVGGGNGDPSQAPEICRAENSDGILIAHEYCNKFYKCNEGRPVAMRCPQGLFFNPATDQCDWPHNVECDREIAPQPQPEESDEDEDNEVIVPGPEPNPESGEGDNSGPGGGGNGDPSQAAEICRAENSEGILVAHEACDKFYICFRSRPFVMTCPRGLFFNPAIDRCDWPENVECNRGSESGEGDNNGPVGGGNGDPSQAPEICRAENSDGILVAHEYCNKFYKCSEGRPVAIRCPQDLFFNPATDQCDWPDNVECDRETAPKPQPEESDEDEDNEVVVPGPEPNPESGEGDNTGPVGGGNGDPSQAAKICITENSEGILIAHESCNKFYICLRSKPVVLSCPQGLFFNSNKEICDWPENVKCDRETAPQPRPEASDEDDEIVAGGGGNDDPSLAPSICAAPESDGVLVAHENCNQFYVCSDGSPVTLTCPLDLMYNPGLEQCDWPNMVDCGNRRVPAKSF